MVFILQIVGLVFATIWTSWRVGGRAVEPVDAIRADLAVIEGEDLSARVPEPPGDDEVARLARAINGTLSRLEVANEESEHALDRQRQFASDASHELRTPVAGLRLRLEEARLYPEESELAEVVNDALGNLDRLESVLTDLLLLARLESEVPQALETVNLTELVEAEAAYSRQKGRLPVRLAADPDVTVEGVPGQLSRALSNLLDNAQHHAERSVTVELGQDADDVELVVTDDGAGIPAGDRERVFQRFTRLDTARGRDHGGTGLGLAIAREIMHAHGGTLQIRDAPYRGARFVLRLPRVQDRERARRRAPAQGPASSRGPDRSDYAAAGRPASGPDYR